MSEPTKQPETALPEEPEIDGRLVERLADYDESVRWGDAADESGEELPVELESTIRRLERHWPRKAGKTATQNPGEVASATRGRRIGKYVLEEEIGRGGFGVVFRALDEESNRIVALKIPRAEVLVAEDMQKRLLREAEIAGGLDHPGIIPILEAGREGMVYYIASQYCPGPDLGEWLNERKQPLEVAEAVTLIRQLAVTLDYAHSQGVVHRDIKPSNVLLMPLDGQAAGEATLGFTPGLTDFGLAQLANCDWSRTRSSLLVGTPLYMAPEQLRVNSEATGPATDIYSLGTLLFELPTLRTPFEAASYVEMIDQLRSSEPPRLGGLRRDVPRDLDTVCLKCLEKQSVDRYASAGALAEDLGRVLNEQPIQAKRPGWLELFQRWCFQPQRIRDAALFGTGYNVVLFTWLVLFQISSHSLNLYSAGQEQAVRIDWLMCLVLQAISTLFCFLITRGYLKFLPIMLLISATHLLLAVGNGLGYLSIYQAIYSESPLLRWSVHSLMVVACLLEVALFAIAMCARRRIGR